MDYAVCMNGMTQLPGWIWDFIANLRLSITCRIMEEFRGLKWGALEPKHLDYKHAEVLFIGQSGSEVPGEGKHEGTSDEMEKLEGEDEVRVRHLEGDEAIFADLELDRKEFGGVESTW